MDLSDPGIKPGSPALQADSLPTEPPGKPSAPSVTAEMQMEGETLLHVPTNGYDQKWGVGSGTSLAVQWLKPHASNAGGTGSVPEGAGKILHASQPKHRNTKWKQYCNKFNKDL